MLVCAELRAEKSVSFSYADACKGHPYLLRSLTGIHLGCCRMHIICIFTCCWGTWSSFGGMLMQLLRVHAWPSAHRLTSCTAACCSSSCWTSSVACCRSLLVLPMLATSSSKLRAWRPLLECCAVLGGWATEGMERI